jgi:hypothetical protein
MCLSADSVFSNEAACGAQQYVGGRGGTQRSPGMVHVVKA